MTSAANAIRMLIRIAGLLLIVLGALFWSGHVLNLVGVHMLVGFILVVLLWVLAVMAGVARVGAGLVALAVLWGLAVLIIGMIQRGLLPGSAHWVIQVVHLLLGLGAIGLAEMLGGRMRRGAGRKPAYA